MVLHHNFQKSGGEIPGNPNPAADFTMVAAKMLALEFDGLTPAARGDKVGEPLIRPR